MMSSAEALAYAECAAALQARDPRISLVYVFGSAVASERLHARDVDLAVLTTPALSLDELMRLRADIVDATRAPIDLVSLNDASIVLAHEVAVSERCLYARTPDVEDAQWRLAGERLAERPSPRRTTRTS